MNIHKLAQKICHRTDGIGADGLMIVTASKKADYRMRIINADGSEAEMCGNGARCMAAYLFHQKKIKTQSLTMETLAGIIHAKKIKHLISVGLSDPKDYKPNVDVSIGSRILKLSFINTGVPHTVCFVEGLEQIDVQTIGRTIRYHDTFAPKGTNVNFIEQLGDDLISIRTYERGVEAETRACGTGSVAAAIIAYLKTNPQITTIKKAKMNVKTASTEILKISFDLKQGQILNVWLTGSANMIAQGNYLIKN
jgi:diaminopimelate epimerase